MKIAKNSIHFLKHISVGGICNLCDSLCDASAVLAIKIDFSKFMERMQLCSSPVGLRHKRTR